MHYPQCNGQGDWTLTLTNADQSGVACLYGPTPGFTIDTNVCQAPAAPLPMSPMATQSFTQQHVDAGQEQHYGPFAAAPGTVFEATMEGNQSEGDPDLYVRFGDEPSVTQHACRPYTAGANETCSVDVPSGAGQSQVFVMVRGYTAGNYNLTVRWTKPPCVC